MNISKIILIIVINVSTVCAHCTSNKNQHALMLFKENRFRHTASSVEVGENRFPLNNINEC